MIRILLYLAVLFAIALGAAWLADRPGLVTIAWQGIEVEVSLMVAVSGLVIGFIALMFIWWAIRSVIGTPRFLVRMFDLRRRERGYQALSQGVVAVGSGDIRRSRKLAEEAERLLGEEPAALLLKAQAAQLDGDRTAARAAFEAMLEVPPAKLLGLHGLFFEAQREGENTAAQYYAEEARQLAPGAAWAGKAVFDYQTAAGNWEAALATLEANTSAKLVDRATAGRYRAVLLTARALELESGEPERARQLALEAHKLEPDLVPAAVVAGRLLSRFGDIRKAMKVLEAAWQRFPHPDIAEGYAQVRPGDSARDRQKRISSLARLRAHHREGAMAVATVAIEAHDWVEARAELAPLLRSAPTQRACLLMAEIEEGEHGDRGRVREWLSRAVHAARDPVWTVDGVVSEDWAPVSPVTGRIDAFEWKVPVASLDATAAPAIEEDLLRPLGPVASVRGPGVQGSGVQGSGVQGSGIAAANPVKASDPTNSESQTSEIATAGSGAPLEGLSDGSAIGGGEESEASGEAVEEITEPPAEELDPRMVEFPLPRAPDDPGTGAKAADGDNSRRFRLF